MYGLIQIVRINFRSTHIQGVLRTKVSQYAIVRPMDRRNVKISPFLTISLQHQIDKSINRAGIALEKRLNSRFQMWTANRQKLKARLFISNTSE